jgi:hypothetical protein
VTPVDRCLIVVRAGDNSVHESWLGDDQPGHSRGFDLAVDYYGRTTGRWEARAEHYSAQPGPKWPCVADWLDRNWSWASSYDYVAIPDDDLSADAEVWRGMFAAMRRYGLDLAQPSFAAESNWCHPITRQHPGAGVRLTNFIENGLVVFSRRALEWCAATMRLGSSGVGTDYAWAAIVRAGGGRVGIVDAVAVGHIRPHHGSGATVHQSVDALASVLPHPEMFDELLLMSTFGVGNPYDPFVEAHMGAKEETAEMPAQGPPGPCEPQSLAAPAVPDGAPAVTFVVVCSGPIAEAVATVGSVLAVRAPFDQVIVVDATFDSHLAPHLQGLPTDSSATTAVSVINAPDHGLAQCYDLTWAAASHSWVVLVAAGWALGPRFRTQLAAELHSTRAELIVVPERPVGVWRPTAALALGGMGALSQRVTTGFGKVGTADLLEAGRSVLARSGAVAFACLEVSVVPARAGGGRAAVGPVGATALPGSGPVSRRFTTELLSAVHPTAINAILALSDVISVDQARQYAALVRAKWPELDAAHGDDGHIWLPDLVVTTVGGPFGTARLVHALLRRNTVAQAAALVLARGLPAHSSPTDVEEAMFALLQAGHGPEALALVSPTSLGPVISSVLTRLPPALADEALDRWWQAQPGSPAVAAGVRAVFPALSPERVAHWATVLGEAAGTPEDAKMSFSTSSGGP